MFLLNLSAAEFFTLLGTLGALITTLYLLDRAKRRRIVSTVRFWVQAGASDERQSRRKMRDPWSLLLQLLSLLLLLLALSRIQWGSADRQGHDHVLLLDTSAWTTVPPAQGAGARTVLAQEKDLLRRYLSSLPPTDRAMLVSVDGLTTPLTRFTGNRRELASALDQTTASLSALNLQTALSFARQAQSWTEGSGGEVVYTGPRMVTDAAPENLPPNVRLLSVPPDRENFGIRHLSVQQLEDEPNSWQAVVTVKNYSSRPHVLRLDVRYGGATFAPRRLTVAADAEMTAEYIFTTRTAAELTASVTPGGSLLADDRASIAVPLRPRLSVAVFTDRPQLLKPLLEANRQLTASFHPTSQYTASVQADVLVFDRFSPPSPPALPTLWIDPSKDRSPIPVKSVAAESLVSWNSAPALESALHAKQLRIPSAHTFETLEGDDVIASVPDGPVVLTRNAGKTRARLALIGFDPAAGELRYQVAIPLLFADLLQGLAPDAFRSLTLAAESVGLSQLTLEGSETASHLQVADDAGLALPFARRGKTLQLFVHRPATLHITSDERERVVSFSLPSVADKTWLTPASASEGIPPSSYFIPRSVDLWKWLAFAAAGSLLLEWFLFGRARLAKRHPRRPQESPVPDRELVAK